MEILHIVFEVFVRAFAMLWEILWPLILGFGLSAVIQATVSHKSLARKLGGDSLCSLILATLFGIASSSCSYAAIAIARSLFQKGASFTASMVFELASTNLVIELGIILVVWMGWQFMVAEYIGGIIMVILLAFIFRLTLTPKLMSLAKQHAEKGLLGRMEGHAAMDMSVKDIKYPISNSQFQMIITSVSGYFVMDWASVWIDILLGFLIAGALAVLVPHSLWQSFFLTNNPTLAKIEGPLIGPLVAIISFVCSVGNIPLAAVLWQGGISFGGVVSFIFADLIVVPILDIYRKYYGWKVMCYILVTFYSTMALAGYSIEFLFSALHIIPTNRNTAVITESISWNYTSFLNIVFLIIAAVFVYRFIKSGGIGMLKMMNKSEHQVHHH